MELTRPVDINSQVNYGMFMNSTTMLQHRSQCYMEEAKDIAKQKLLEAHLIHKLKNREETKSLRHGLCSRKVISSSVLMPTTPLLKTPYPYKLELGSPIVGNDWNPMNTPPNYQSYNQPSPSPIFATNIYPFGGTVEQPVITSMIPQTFVQNSDINCSRYGNESLSNQITEKSDVKETQFIQECTTTELEKVNDLNNNNIEKINTDKIEGQGNPLEEYLTLPKELFPTARMSTVDPNAIIDEFCKMPNIERHVPWILDLEFGIPRTLNTRPLPIYNVKFNSVHCKNTPDAIHPGFESCTPDFKRALLFYYDCVFSAWYRGYMMSTSDRSVENFQSWLLQPTQVLGMCWP